MVERLSLFLFEIMFEMKAFIPFFICWCFASVNLFAQTPKSIKDDLSKLSNKIDYWSDKARDETTEDTSFSDSLEDANDKYGKKLQFYTSTYPFTLNQNFNSLGGVSSSSDNLFRIYTWDTYTGGTMHLFDNVFQYKSQMNVKSFLQKQDTTGNANDYIYCYSKIYTLKAKDITYYLASYIGVFSNKDIGQGIQVFSIKNGKLNANTKVIKTGSGFHSRLYYEYEITDNTNNTDIQYDSSKKTISLPIIVGEGIVTNKRITYKFTGKYFEKVKN